MAKEIDEQAWVDASTCGTLFGAVVALDGILSILEAEVGPAEINDPPAAEMYHEALNTVQVLYDRLNGLREHLVQKHYKEG